jgi:hypothetical protein
MMGARYWLVPVGLVLVLWGGLLFQQRCADPPLAPFRFTEGQR